MTLDFAALAEQLQGQLQGPLQGRLQQRLQAASWCTAEQLQGQLQGPLQGRLQQPLQAASWCTALALAAACVLPRAGDACDLGDPRARLLQRMRQPRLTPSPAESEGSPCHQRQLQQLPRRSWR